MAWMEVHQELRYHPKVKELATSLTITTAQARGHVVSLWCWALMFAQDGQLGKFSTKQIAEAADWPAEADGDKFVEAMKQAGWLDAVEGGYSIHDWEEMGIKYLEGKRKRQKRYRRRKRHGDATVTSPKGHGDGIPNHTLPNHTLPNQTSPDQVAAPPPFDAKRQFEEVWQKYPNKDGKAAAQRHFLGTVKSEPDLQRILKALGNYLHSRRVREGYIKNGSTWFNNWQDWENYTEDGNGRSGQGGYVSGGQRRIITPEDNKRVADAAAAIKASRAGGNQ